MRTKPIYLIACLVSLILGCISCTDEPEDNLDPLCRIISPADSVEVQAGDTVTIAAEAEDTDGLISSVLFYFNGVPLGSASLSPYTIKYVPAGDQAGYHPIRATALDAQGGQAFDEITVHVVINLPVVQTLDLTFDEQNRLVLGGIITDDGGSEITSRGVCWSTDPHPTIEDEHTVVGSGTGTFTSILSDLLAGTLYYIRAYASNSNGTSYGNELTYLLVTPPVVRTLPLSGLTNITVDCAGSVISDGGDSIFARGFCWGDQPMPDLDKDHSLEIRGADPFSVSLTGLRVNSTYYCRAYATNSKGTTYGEDIRFTTLTLEYGSVTDGRDNRTYGTVRIADQWWMSENLNVGVFIESSISTGQGNDMSDNGIIEKYCFNNEPGICDFFGGLYVWDEMMQYRQSDTGVIGTVQGICPAGWHLPTDREWQTLEVNLGMSPAEAEATGIRGNHEGTKIKEKDGDHWLITDPVIADEVSFNALPAGIRLIDGHFDALGVVTSFWTSTIAEDEAAWYRHLTDDFNGILRGDGADNEGFSVRCVKD